MQIHRIFWLLALVIAGLGALVFAALNGANRVDVVLHDLRATPDLKALRLVQISDLHLKAFGAHEQSLVSQLDALQPDVVVLSGDAVDRADALPLLQSFVKAFAPVPVLLAPGNWEHWSGLDFIELQNMLAGSGAKLLLNDRWSMSRADRTSTNPDPHSIIWVFDLGFFYPKESRLLARFFLDLSSLTSQPCVPNVFFWLLLL